MSLIEEENYKWLTVDEEAALLHRCAYLERRLMETQAGWLTTFYWLEDKLDLGVFLYEDAMHADVLAARLPELRWPASHVFDPVPELEALMNEAANEESESHRITALYAVIKPELLACYRWLLKATDPIGDAPTQRMLQRIIRDETNHIEWAASKLSKIEQKEEDTASLISWENHVRSALKAAGGIRGGEQGSQIELHNPGPPQRLQTFMPLRDDRYTVVPWQSLERGYLPSIKDRDSLLRLLNQLTSAETAAAEALARLVVDFPDLPWKMQLDLIRQAWDEVRHARMAKRRLEELGGKPGMYPVENWLYEFVGFRKDPYERLIGLQRVVEGFALDLHRNRVDILKEINDEASALMFDYIAADEIMHVKISKWLAELTNGSPDLQQKLMEQEHELEAELMANIAWREEWPEETFQ